MYKGAMSKKTAGIRETNTTYISERVRESLRMIAGSALTIVTAPMGYGKTTAVNWFLSGQIHRQRAKVIRINIYSGHLSLFWTSVQNAFADAGLVFLKDFSLPEDTVGEGLLLDELCRALAGNTPHYIFLDDYHLLKREEITGFICRLAKNLPENAHIIIASRDRFLKNSDIVNVGARLHQIDKEQLCLNHTELSVYAERCGLELTDTEVDEILTFSEGWFSAIYFAMRSYAESGHLPEGKRDIYELFISAMMDPLPEKKKEFLAVMGLADEFTSEMADYVTGSKTADRLLSELIGQNSFVKLLSDGVTYRFHHMMKECALRYFSTMAGEKQRVCLERYGAWYQEHGQYIHALMAYQKIGDHDAMLGVIEKDTGILLASIEAEEILRMLEDCGDEVLKKHPTALLVLMRRMFTWRQIPVMLRLKGLLEAAIDEDRTMPAQKRGNLLGERDLVMSFLMYNDIKAMSLLHRSAASQMSGLAVSMSNEGSWTFGSPSVLMMFHRAPGELQGEIAAMNECMPYYYKLTNGHGQGAELIIEAEAALMQCRYEDAEIYLERARARCAEYGQINMDLCCDFLESRLMLCSPRRENPHPEERRTALIRMHDSMWLNINDCTCAYQYALQEEVGKIPEVFSGHRLSQIRFLMPCKPMMEMVENQVYLAQGEYTKVIGRSEGLLGMCAGMHYALVALHIQIQTAAAYERIGKREAGEALLRAALQSAVPDALYMPFIENYAMIAPMLPALAAEAEELRSFIERVLSEGKNYVKSSRGGMSSELMLLSEKEMEIVRLIAEHFSNKEIAEKLYLSEGTVKQYMNRIYAKLAITGDHHNKRKLLSEYLKSHNS